MFNKGYYLLEILDVIYPNGYSNESLNAVLSFLGFQNRNEYKEANSEIYQMMLSEAKREAQKFENAEILNQINEIFSTELPKLDKIRRIIFPDLYEVKRDRVERLYRKKVIDFIILKALQCDDWDEYNRLRRNTRSRINYRRKKGSGFIDIKDSIIERDCSKCVISGEAEYLEIHHIDGNDENNDPSNLITVTKEVQLAIHNGARGLTEDRMKFHEQHNPRYAKLVKKRLEYLKKYVQYLMKIGHENVCLESIPADILFGTNLHRTLHINARGKRRSGYYWVVVLKPTGFHEQPHFTPKESRYDYLNDEYGEIEFDEDFQFGDTMKTEKVKTCPKCGGQTLRAYLTPGGEYYECDKCRDEQVAKEKRT